MIAHNYQDKNSILQNNSHKKNRKSIHMLIENVEIDIPTTTISSSTFLSDLSKDIIEYANQIKKRDYQSNK